MMKGVVCPEKSTYGEQRVSQSRDGLFSASRGHREQNEKADELRSMQSFS